MDIPSYGLRRRSGLDSPFGVFTRRPVVPLPGPTPLLPPPVQRGPVAPAPRPMVHVPAIAQTQNVVPSTPTTVQSNQTSFPIVGKDVPLERFVDLQRRAESSGNYQALNTEKAGNTASGAYQYTDATWNNYGGYPKAMLAPKEVQDRRFAEDVARRVRKYNGDMFKALAEHYLPIQANKPQAWREPATFKVNGKNVTVRPVESYLRQVLKDTPYLSQLDAYLEQQAQ